MEEKKYQVIIEMIYNKMDEVKKDKKKYNKLKKILAFLSVAVLPFGLWQVSIVFVLSSLYSAYRENKKKKEYSNLIDELENEYIPLQLKESNQEEAKEDDRENEEERIIAPSRTIERAEDELNDNRVCSK